MEISVPDRIVPDFPKYKIAGFRNFNTDLHLKTDFLISKKRNKIYTYFFLKVLTGIPHCSKNININKPNEQNSLVTEKKNACNRIHITYSNLVKQYDTQF